MEYAYIRDYFYNRDDALKDSHIIDIQNLIYFFDVELALKLHIHYGTLLGAVRRHDFIPHDVDIDLVYISNFTKKEDVRQEIVEIADKLNQRQMLIKDFNNRGHMHIRVPDGVFVVDVFTSWVDDNGRYNLIPFGNICSADFIYPFKRERLRGAYFDIPNKSEELLCILYKDWDIEIEKQDSYLKLPKRSILA